MAQSDGHGLSRQLSSTMDISESIAGIEILEPETFSSPYENEDTIDTVILNPSSSPTQGYTSDGSQDSCHMEDVTEKGYMPVHVKVGLNRVESVSGDKIPSYKMTSNPRGLALIIDIEKYDNEIQDERIGSEVIWNLNIYKICVTYIYYSIH